MRLERICLLSGDRLQVAPVGRDEGKGLEVAGSVFRYGGGKACMTWTSVAIARLIACRRRVVELDVWLAAMQVLCKSNHAGGESVAPSCAPSPGTRQRV